MDAEGGLMKPPTRTRPTLAISEADFQDPPAEYRPYVFLSPTDGLPRDAPERLSRILGEYQFGGFVFSPNPTFDGPGLNSEDPEHRRGRPYGLMATYPAGASPWLPRAEPGEDGMGSYLDESAGAAESRDPSRSMPAGDPIGFLTDEYFDLLGRLLETARRLGKKAIFYDEAGYPSGMADHTVPERHHRKSLTRVITELSGPTHADIDLPGEGLLMAVVAANDLDRRRIDLRAHIKNRKLSWDVPEGRWRLLVFSAITTKATGVAVDYDGATDYLDPDAVQWFIDRVYAPHAARVGSYFGDTITLTFFDDVGIAPDEKTWALDFNEKFERRIGCDPTLFYPALWEDIGPQTEAARIAFFDTRAELLANGFPRVISEWGRAHGIDVSGHATGNYSPQPVDMDGDPFKFYRAQQVPMVDVIFGHGFGRDGFKLISSAAVTEDKPIVAAETIASGAHLMGYRRTIELFVRGVNLIIGGAPTPSKVDGPTAFSDWAGRSSLLLRGGRHVADLAVLYPVESLQAHYRFDEHLNLDHLPRGMFVPHEADFLALGEILVNDLHRDFTFIHPESVINGRVRMIDRALELDVEVNHQRYQALILPGARVIDLDVLERIVKLVANGGTVIATSMLPSKASALVDEHQTGENDRHVRLLVSGLFGIDPAGDLPSGAPVVRADPSGGRTAFVPHPDVDSLGNVLDRLGLAPDVQFEGQPRPRSGTGRFGYIHKVHGDQHVYYFGNSSDDVIDTTVELRVLLDLETWNLKTGGIERVRDVRHDPERLTTRLPLRVDPVSAACLVGRPAGFLERPPMTRAG
jgi:hypothetical protein